MSKSWVVRIWLVILLLSFLAAPVAMLLGNGPGSTPASAALTVYLGLWLGVWSIVIIVLSAGSVSLEAEIVADSILCRACTRTQYILAKLASRALVIGGVYLLAASAAAYVSWRYGANDVTFVTVATGIAIVGLALLMLVSLGVAMSTIFNNTIVSIVGLLLLWHVAGALFAFAGVEYMSPTSLTGRLPEILRDSRAPRVVSCSATRTSVSIVFSKNLDPDSAEQLDNYTVEDSAGDQHVPQKAVYDSATATVRLSGLDPELSKPVTVTVEGVTDSAGNEVSPGANEVDSGPIPAPSEDEPEDRPDDEEGAEADDEEEEEAANSASAALFRPAMASIVMTALIVAPSLPVAAQGPIDGVEDEVTPPVGETTPGQGANEPEAAPVDESPPPPPHVAADADSEDEDATTEPEPVPEEGEGETEAEPVDEQPPPSPEEPPRPQPAEVTTPAPPVPQPPAAPAASPAAAPIMPGPAPPASSGLPPGPIPANVPPSPVPAAPPAPSPADARMAPAPEAGADEPDSSPNGSTGRAPRVTKVTATRTTVSVTFSQDMDPAEVEELANYTIESPPGTTRLPKTAAYDPSEKTVLLSGLSLAAGDPVKVTVENVTSRRGAEIDPRHNSETFSEVQTWKYLVGFGVPALLFALVGVVWFSWRDL